MKKRKKEINIHQKIIDDCKKGKQKAQFQLYKLYYKAMYNTSLRILGNTAEAEDVMQEAFFAAFDKIKTYKGEVSFGAWLKKIVINKSLDELKKKKVSFDDIDDMVYKLEDSKESETEDNDFDFKVEIVKKAINQLPEGYRVILSLYLLEGYDHEEISQILNITSSTSRSQLTRAKKKLQEILHNFN